MTNYIESINQLKEAVAKIEEQKKKIAEEIGHPAFIQAFLKLKEAVPAINSVYWTQYTPHWNDGESCDFSVHDYYFTTKLDEEVGFEPDYDDLFSYLQTSEEIANEKIRAKERKEKYLFDLDQYQKGLVKYKPYDPGSYTENNIKISEKLHAIYGDEEIHKIRKAMEEFNTFFHTIPHDIFEQIFGDHAKITIQHDGKVEVEEYSHD